MNLLFILIFSYFLSSQSSFSHDRYEMGIEVESPNFKIKNHTNFQLEIAESNNTPKWTITSDTVDDIRDLLDNLECKTI